MRIEDSLEKSFFRFFSDDSGYFKAIKDSLAPVLRAQIDAVELKGIIGADGAHSVVRAAAGLHLSRRQCMGG